MRIQISFIGLSLSMVCQGQFLLPCKEQSDHIVHKQVYNGNYAGLQAYTTAYVDPWSSYRYAEPTGQLCLGYLRMYRTTRDRAYLYKCVNLSLRAMAWRRQNQLFTDGTFPGSSLYMNGVLLWALSDLAHLIMLEEPDLAQEQVDQDLLSIPNSTIPGNIIPVADRVTFGNVAQWLTNRARETLDGILAVQWSEDLALGQGGDIHGLNQEAVFGSAMLNLGHIGSSVGDAGLLAYLDKGALMLRKMRYASEDDRCACILGTPVLHNNTNYSYYWYHDGWSHPRRDLPCPYVDCNGESGFAVNDLDLTGRNQFTEDISHAVYDLELPRLANAFNIFTGGSEPFTDDDMVRFRNTFTTHIAQPDQGTWGFCSGVFGCNAPTPIYGNYGYNYYKTHAFAWMFLQEWDAAPGSAPGAGVYDILTEFYGSVIFPDPTMITGGLSYWGLAQLVAAQWENECFDLTLYNRDLVYDQDFAAKDVLTVDAFGEAGASFADPVITDPRFTVNAGVHAGFRAGHAVVWEPGFEAEPGSVVEATIDPLGCELMYRNALVGAGPGPLIDRNEVPDPSAPDPVAAGKAPLDDTARAEALLTWMPDTGGAEAGLRLVLPTEAHVIVELWDGLGRRIHVVNVGQRTEGAHEIPLPVTDIASGLYIAVVWLNGSPHTMRSFVP